MTNQNLTRLSADKEVQTIESSLQLGGAFAQQRSTDEHVIKVAATFESVEDGRGKGYLCDAINESEVQIAEEMLMVDDEEAKTSPLKEEDQEMPDETSPLKVVADSKN